jgi:hypothetical protein
MRAPCSRRRISLLAIGQTEGRGWKSATNFLGMLLRGLRNDHGNTSISHMSEGDCGFHESLLLRREIVGPTTLLVASFSVL